MNHETKSVSDNGSDISTSLLGDVDLAEAVSKLAQDFVQIKQKCTQLDSILTAKSKGQEENLSQLRHELIEVKTQRTELEKRIESAKSALTLSNQEVAKLTLEVASLRENCMELESTINKKNEAEKLQKFDSNSPEIQALEEENIELLKENKQLRKEIGNLKSFSRGEENTNNHASQNVEPSRRFGTELGNLIPLQTVNNSMKPKEINDIDTKRHATLIEEPKTKTPRIVPPVPAGSDENNPGDCVQS
jgi:chromosome segregation ATPase